MARRLVPPAAAYAVAAALALVLLAPTVPWLLGPEYRNVVEVIRWLAVIPVLRALHYFAADALTGSGHQGWRTAAQLTVAGFNVALNVVLIPRYSWRGAVWASIASDAALALLLWAVLGALVFRASAPNAVIGPLAPERT
jgi:O-antigen/teichoic acid export membrane protein